MTTALVTDSTCYLSAEDAARLGVRVVPLTVMVGELSRPETEVDPAEFYAGLRAGGPRPTTSQPAPGDFLAAFTAAAGAGADRVLCVTATSPLSGTARSARLAAPMAPVPVDVVDSGTVSGGLVLVVSELAHALADGAGHDEAVALAGDLGSRVASAFVADSLPLLRAGGRLPEGTGGDGVPVLALEGELRTLGTVRDLDAAQELMVSVLRGAAAAHPTPVTVGHGDVEALADALAAAVVGLPGVTRVDRYVVGPVVGAHVGPGNVGLSYLRPPSLLRAPGGDPRLR